MTHLLSDDFPNEPTTPAALSIGSPAPVFESAVGDSTIGLKDFKGNWVIVFTQPADVLPLFRTRTLNHLLCKRRTKVIALVREEMADAASGGNFLKRYILKRRLTVLGDPDRRIEVLYGLHGDDIKGAFIVDPKGILRARLCSPAQSDRNFHEILTVLDALQAADRQKDGKPETVSWKKRLKIAIKARPAEQT